ncbi:hypothetical protein [Methylobacter sp.]|uniref:hypothetical protein n=1 Tax=Methylobacter sp. TaxID=2051955 RepID=UPI0024887AC3|nr:hypothetical protein [Methylobacter sp.]MDI1277274.1 hypothetical protein [Methylobacter sp.]MDI1357840.1 hypothetical protein [Methylobacter sp.]
MTSLFIKNIYTKCKMHGGRDAQVILADDELYALIVIALNDLGWLDENLHTKTIQLPSNDYYAITLEWFETLKIGASVTDIMETLDAAKNKGEDFVLYIDNLSALHRRRIKYRRILSMQPMPTMDQIGPRVLLEFGTCDSSLLANWMMWRKWIYDIDNRAAQETGYVFEPIIASCLGGESVGARNSPVKRVDKDGSQTTNGRQIDCYVPSSNIAYEVKLRVTIAASGQGRFGEELSFPFECQAAGIKPVLLVLDPTPSNRLDELSKKFIDCGGELYQGEDSWLHMEEKSGEVVSVFIEKYIRPAISEIEEIHLATLEQITLTWEEQKIIISGAGATYQIKR